MSWTKKQLIESALSEIGLSNYIFDIQADELQTYVRRLDSMMATWALKGIQVGWPLPGVAYDASDLTTETGLQDTAIEAVSCNLALAIAPSLGRTPMPDTRMRAKEALNALMVVAAIPPEKQLPSTLPRGQGQRYNQVYNPFFNPPVEPLSDGQAQDIELE